MSLLKSVRYMREILSVFEKSRFESGGVNLDCFLKANPPSHGEKITQNQLIDFLQGDCLSFLKGMHFLFRFDSMVDLSFADAFRFAVERVSEEEPIKNALVVSGELDFFSDAIILYVLCVFAIQDYWVEDAEREKMSLRCDLVLSSLASSRIEFRLGAVWEVFRCRWFAFSMASESPLTLIGIVSRYLYQDKYSMQIHRNLYSLHSLGPMLSVGFDLCTRLDANVLAKKVNAYIDHSGVNKVSVSKVLYDWSRYLDGKYGNLLGSDLD